MLFIGYEGFGLVTNAARDMRDPRTMLPRALYTSVILVIIIYLAVSLTVSGNLTDAQIEQAKDYALAEAAKPFLGEFGFRLIAIAALFSTASAINATLFGSANVCYMIARDGELPGRLAGSVWKGATGGLLLTAGLVVLVTLGFDLSGIAMMGSAAFLLVYAAVNAGHLRVLKETGANAIIVWLSLITCLAMFVMLCIYTWRQQPAAIVALVIIAARVVRGGMGLPALDRPHDQAAAINSTTKKRDMTNSSCRQSFRFLPHCKNTVRRINHCGPNHELPCRTTSRVRER